ncbi:MAG: hypothetical protein ACO1SV_14185 [Fimbriimonas sp.]
MIESPNPKQGTEEIVPVAAAVTPLPDPLFRKYLPDGDTLILLDVEDSCIIPGGIPSDLTTYKRVRIYAEDIVLGKTLALRNGYLSVWSLTLAPKGNFSVRGADGQPGGQDTKLPGARAKSGTDGTPGGDLTLIVGSAPLGAPAADIDARGGNGGDGQNNLADAPSSTGGNGGKGGKGGQVRIYVRTREARLTAILAAIHNATEGSIRRSAIERLDREVASLGSAADTLMIGTEPLAKIPKRLRELAPAEDDDASEEFTDLLTLTASVIRARDLNAKSQFATRAFVSNGNGGAYGTGVTNGNTGEHDVPGTFAMETMGDFGRLAKADESDLLFAHPDQCALLLQRARQLYFVGDIAQNPEGTADAAALLNRLVLRTAPFANLPATSALAKAYAKEENERLLGSVGCVAALARIYGTATTLQQQMSQGMDSFGRPRNYTPLASYEFYSGQLAQMIEWFGKLEDGYRDYFATDKDAKKEREAVQDILEGSRQSVEDSQKAVKDLYGIARDSLQDILTFDVAIRDERATVVPMIDRFKEKLDKHFDVDFKEIFAAVSTIAFAPESGWMWATQAAGTLYKFDHDIVTDDGQTLPKKYMVRQVGAIGGSIKQLVEGFKVLPDGTIGEDDAGAALLLAEQKSLYRLLDSIYDKFTAEVDELKTAFKKYVDVVLARNQEILKYNSAILLILQHQNSIQDITAKKEALTREFLEDFNPSLPIVTSFVATMYERARDQVLAALYMTARSYRFWALSDENLVASLLGGKSPTSIDKTVLAGVQQQILARYSATVEAFGHGAQHYPKDESKRGLFVNLKEAELRTLTSKGAVKVRILAPSADPNVASNPFREFADVRVNRVRFWLEGVTEKPGAPAGADKNVHVRLTHTGTETIENDLGHAFEFSHAPELLTFIYDNATLEPVQEGEFVITPGGSKASYALYGPFTWWQVEIVANPWLDFSHLTGAKFEFQFYNYTCKAKRP